ncbi:MAG: DUF5915 domain-containing protein, partial [Thaumarchaeota archaeon]|nr:DUF5915 domain-containing protein [Nitrososphaerota archaeon]
IVELSQTYVPIIRGEILEENEESKNRRQVIYSVLGLVLIASDTLLHPIAPFVTDYLAGKCFGTESVLLADWPSSEAKFRNKQLEVEFDLLANAISITNSARMKAKLKRRWPLKEAYFLSADPERELLLASEDVLRDQINVTDVKFVTDPKEMPVVVSVKPNFELLAPKVKNRMNEVASKLAKTDPAWLFNQISSEGKTRLPDLKDIELTESDVIFSFAPSDPKYSVVENFGIVVALDTSRNDELIARGLVKDLARNVQALRKEKGFNPTEVLDSVKIAGLGNQNIELIKSKLEELAFLVRVKKAELYPDLSESQDSWNRGELDGTQIRILIS